MGSIVTVNGTHAVDATTAVELIRVKADTVNPFILHSIRIGQSSDAGDAEAEMLRVVLDRYTGAGDGGAGGAAVVVSPHELTQATPGVTGYVGSTTLSTVRTTIIEDAFNVQAGWLYLPTPEERIAFGGGTGVVVGLPVGPATNAMTFMCSVTVEEILVA